MMKLPQIISIIFLAALFAAFLSIAKFYADYVSVSLDSSHHFILSYRNFFSFLAAGLVLILFLVFVFRSAKKKMK